MKRIQRGELLMSPLIGAALFLIPGFALRPLAEQNLLVVYIAVMVIATGVMAWIHGADWIRISVLVMLSLIGIWASLFLGEFVWAVFRVILPAAVDRLGGEKAFFVYQIMMTNGIFTAVMFGVLLRGRRSLLVFPLLALVLHGIFLAVFAQMGLFDRNDPFDTADPLYVLLPLGLTLGWGLAVVDRFFPKKGSSDPVHR